MAKLIIYHPQKPSQEYQLGAFNSLGRLFALGGLLWTLIIGYHIVMGAASGPTAYINIILTALLALGFYLYSRD